MYICIYVYIHIYIYAYIYIYIYTLLFVVGFLVILYLLGAIFVLVLDYVCFFFGGGGVVFGVFLFFSRFFDPWGLPGGRRPTVFRFYFPISIFDVSKIVERRPKTIPGHPPRTPKVDRCFLSAKLFVIFRCRALSFSKLWATCFLLLENRPNILFF